MSQGVDRLKELLFDSEARTLSDLAKRVDVLAKTEAEGRAGLKSENEVLGRRLDGVFERAGSVDRFQSSVADVLDGAIRKAEVERHAAMSDAVAPLVVRTVKSEIRNSQDELVEALYPMTGRMVKAYVASAIKDLTNDINRKLEQNPVMLRLRSLATGRSVAELAIAEAQQLDIEELYLIRRGSGELLARWPEAAETASRDHVMSGVLTAINEFSSEALKEEGSNLRQIDIGERQLYLRASPVYLLAAKSSGTAAPDIEALLDDAFLGTIESLNKTGDLGGAPGDGTASRTELLSHLSVDLDKRIAAKQAELAESGMGLSPLKMLAWIVGVPLAAWLSWSIFVDYRTERAHAIAARIIAESKDLSGYPTQLSVERLGRAVTVSGLAPSLAAKSDVVDRLKSALPSSEIRDEMSVLPSGLAEVEPELRSVRRNVAGLEPELDKVRKNIAGLEPEINKMRRDLASVAPEISKVKGDMAAFEAEVARASVRRAIEQSARRLGQLRLELGRLDQTVGSTGEHDLVRRASGTIEQAAKDLETQRAAAATDKPDPRDAEKLNAALIDLTTRLRSAGTDLSGLLVSGAGFAPPPATKDTKPGSVPESAEVLNIETERLASVTVAVSQIAAFKKALPTAREKLEAWSRSNAIFFGNDLEFRNPVTSNRALDDLAALMKASGDLVRVIGYTDEKGGQTKNSPLSQSRANAVMAALIDRGVPPARLVALGRVDTLDISPTTGAQSPNRRVEFEVGFAGEGQE